MTPPTAYADLATRLARVYQEAQRVAATTTPQQGATMYAADPRTWADIICDEAPPVPAAVRAEAQRAVFEPREGTLLALLLVCGDFTAESAAENLDCWPSSIRTTLRNHPGCFEQVQPHTHSKAAVWRAKAVR
jgi:hypothetical protein